MTHTELKQVILDYFRELYKCEFIGDLKIEDLDPVGYKVSINVNHSENPIVIIGDMEDDEFLKYIYEEIRYRKLQRVKHDVLMHYDSPCK